MIQLKRHLLKIKESPVTGYTWLLGIISFLYLSFFRYEGPWNWDDLTYLFSMLNQKQYPVLLGRTGFCYPFIAFWSFLKSFTEINFLFIEKIVLLSNLILMALSYVLTFRLLLKVKVPVTTAFIAVLILVSELSFSVLGSRYNDTPLMLFCLLGSFYLFIQAHERRNFRRLLASAAVAGYSILAREPAAFFFFFFVVAYFWFKKEGSTFSWRQYVLATLLLAVMAVSGPLLLLIFQGTEFVNSVKTTLNIYTAKDDMAAKFKLFMNSQINVVLAISCFGGLFFALKRMKIIWMASFVFVCLAPALVTYSFLEFESVVEARYYYGLFVLFAVGSAFLVTAVADKIHSNFFSKSFLTVAVAGLMYAGTVRYWTEYQRELRLSRDLPSTYLKLAPLLSGRTALIFGNETMYLRYRTKVEGQDAAIISAGMYWPTGRLEKVITEYLSDGRTVIYDPRGDEHNYPVRKDDLNRMRAQFLLTEMEHGLFKVDFKKH